MKHKFFFTTIFLVGLVILIVSLNLAFRQSEETVSYITLPQYPPMHIGYTDGPLGVAFSHNAGFYDESFYLTLSAPMGATIYYTLDGSTPTEHSLQYTSPIYILAPSPAPSIAQFDRVTTSRVTVFSINAIAIMAGEISEVITQNFVMGTDVYTRFCENTFIFALNSAPHGLFDHYDGILVPGIDRELFRQDYYDTYGILPTIGYNYYQENPASPANFNRRGRESERQVHVQMFDHTGILHISQQSGMRVRGGFSRAHEPQKSLELFAREAYGDNRHFLFPFFADEHTYDGQLIDRYRRLRLRNGGSDRYAGFIRDELSQTLFRQAGHSDTQTHVPAAIFLNGEYYGVAWLKTPRTPNHLRRRYGGITANFETVHGGDNLFIESRWEGEPHATEDLLEVSILAAQGFVGEGGQARFEEFTQRVDLHSLIRYYAMQLYINNIDWPNHNIEMWRYFPTEEEKNDPNLHPYLRDGRWRVFAHDLEAGWAIWDDHNRMSREDPIRDVLVGDNPYRWNSHNGSAFLSAIVGHDYTKAKLANTFIDLIEGAFAPDNVINVLEDLISQIENEHNHAMRINAINPQDGWWPTIDGVNNSRNAIRRFAQDRPAFMYASIYSNLGFNRSNKFSINITTTAGGGAIMNSRPVTELQSVTGNYFTGTQINITARPYPGYIIDHWMVNGIRQYGNIITLSDNSDIVLYFSEV